MTESCYEVNLGRLSEAYSSLSASDFIMRIK